MFQRANVLKAVIEATFNWLIVDEAILAHPLKTRAIAEARIIPRAYTPFQALAIL